ASRARAITSSRSPSNAGSARWAWLSMKRVMKRKNRRGGGGSAIVQWPSAAGDHVVRATLPTLFGNRSSGPLSLGARGSRPLALDPEQQGRGNIDGAERSGEDTEGHHPRERPDDLTREDQERERRSQRGRVREDRPWQRL